MHWELLDVQAGFQRGRGTRDPIANIYWILGKVKECQDNIDFCFSDYTVWTAKLWKILKETGVPDYVTCLPRHLYGGQEATVNIRHVTMEQFQIVKGVQQGVYCHPAYLMYIPSTSCKILGWMNRKIESGLLGEMSTTSDMQMVPL